VPSLPRSTPLSMPPPPPVGVPRERGLGRCAPLSAVDKATWALACGSQSKNQSYQTPAEAMAALPPVRFFNRMGTGPGGGSPGVNAPGCRLLISNGLAMVHSARRECRGPRRKGSKRCGRVLCWGHQRRATWSLWCLSPSRLQLGGLDPKVLPIPALGRPREC